MGQGSKKPPSAGCGARGGVGLAAPPVPARQRSPRFGSRFPKREAGGELRVHSSWAGVQRAVGAKSCSYVPSPTASSPLALTNGGGSHLSPTESVCYRHHQHNVPTPVSPQTPASPQTLVSPQTPLRCTPTEAPQSCPTRGAVSQPLAAGGCPSALSEPRFCWLLPVPPHGTSLSGGVRRAGAEEQHLRRDVQPFAAGDLDLVTCMHMAIE